MAVLALAMSCGGEPAPPQGVAATAAQGEPSAEAQGRDLFLGRGCAACHGQDAQGSDIAPALPGHSKAAVTRQVRAPLGIMPAYSVTQLSDEELEAIARYIEGLASGGHHVEPVNMDGLSTMHHWMTLLALDNGNVAEAKHHVQHIIGLVSGDHLREMKEILEEIEAEKLHDAEHSVQGMLAGSAEPDLALPQLHLRLALGALEQRKAPDAQHHLDHYSQAVSETDAAQGRRVLELIRAGELHDAEHDIQELLGQAHQD